MERYKKLETIANSINAAAKISSIYTSNSQMRSSSATLMQKLSVLGEIIEVLARFSPGVSGEVLNETASRTAVYSNTYKNLKRSLGSFRGKPMGSAAAVRTLEVARPILNSQQKRAVDKLSGIYKILNS